MTQISTPSDCLTGIATCTSVDDLKTASAMEDKVIYCGECDCFTFCADDIDKGDWNGDGACVYDTHHGIHTLSELLDGATICESVNKNDKCQYGFTEQGGEK